MRFVRIFLFAILAIYLCWRGLFPAFTKLDSDFPNYYVSAQLLSKGEDLSRLYDDDWFQQRIYSHGINQQGKFTPFPPVTALVFVPLALLSPLAALRVWTVFNIGILIGTIVILARITKKDWIWCSLIVLLSGHALANNFRLGQFYLVLTFLVIAGYYFAGQGAPLLAGLALGIGAAVKYFPAIFLPVYIVNKKWEILFSFLASFLAIVTVGIVVVGTDVHKEFVNTVFFSHLSGNLQDPFNYRFQSWNSLFRRLFIYDKVLNQNPVFDSSDLAISALLLVYVVVAIATFWGLRRAQRIDSAPLQFAVLGLAGMVLLPASATYHYLLLIPLVAVILTDDNYGITQNVILVLYILIGFIPYGLTGQFDGRGFYSLVAYPRLVLITLIFTTTLFLIAKRSKTEHVLNHGHTT